MPKKKKIETRNIPTRNYYFAFFVFAAIILISLYALKWYQVKEKELYRESYLVKTDTVSLEVNNIKELKQVFQETPETYFIFIGYKNDKDEYILEKDLKPIIENYNLKDVFYYVDATKIMKDEDYISNLNINLYLTNERMKKLPAIIYFNEGTYKIIDSNIKTEFNNILEKDNFEN